MSDNMTKMIAVISGDFKELMDVRGFRLIFKDKLAFIGSSTFTDTKDVRDKVIYETVEKLRSRGKVNGLSVVAVDMRYKSF